MITNQNYHRDRKERIQKELIELLTSEEMEICNRKLVYNLSDKQIPKETEDLVG